MVNYTTTVAMLEIERPQVNVVATLRPVDSSLAALQTMMEVQADPD